MMCCELKLVFDFLDYYDHWFDLEGEIFRRVSTDGMSRREMLVYLSSIGLKTPPFGTVQELWNKYNDIEREILNVVVYLDETAHRGEGKLKLPIKDAVKQYRDCLATVYIPSTTVGFVSWRYLQVGSKIFWVEYKSSDWRSNYGDVEITVLMQEEDSYNQQIHLPLFAIDFVPADRLYAVDFNIAPQVRGTGVEDLLPAKEAVNSIKEAYCFFKKEGL